MSCDSSQVRISDKEATRSMTEQLKCVTVGAGYFARFQYEAWRRIPEVTVAAVCNRSIDKANAVAAEFGIANTYGFDRFDEMLQRERPDFVDIITPPETHLELCQTAIARGVAIVCQKPLAPTWDETLELAKLVRASDVPFMVHENWRWQPWYREIKKLLDDGVIGEPHQVAFQCRLGDGWGEDAYLARQPFFRDYPRLFLFETGVHFLDTFRFLLGEPTSIYARTARRNSVIKGEDTALVVLDFGTGVTAMLDANRYNEPDASITNPRYTFGALRLDGSRGHLELRMDGSICVQLLGEQPRPHEYSPATEGFAGDCVYAVQRHFVDSLRSGEFESTVDDYLRSVKLVELAYESAANNTVVAVPDEQF